MKAGPDDHAAALRESLVSATIGSGRYRVQGAWFRAGKRLWSKADEATNVPAKGDCVAAPAGDQGPGVEGATDGPGGAVRWRTDDV